MALGTCILGSICVGLVCAQIARRVLPWLYLNVFAPTLFGPKVDLRRLGDWAVVTGATDGIGKAYAKAQNDQRSGTFCIKGIAYDMTEDLELHFGSDKYAGSGIQPTGSLNQNLAHSAEVI
ncbi:very-long-chain 3-oxooacyl-coA reductase let-767-like [Teleopsis dalmanni]|uniref:very-long-chain 3-oxooacyl-coA reductase let-767-like n=1 Tax=Teleopsis dalmanni TaxID=139649 RepID=UPI0018CCCBFA|nr:very-long-chain 3-oxooacyl-coA reductase let-767-like [Teleopsis dalmanni]